jgi:hypothetical protein
MAGWRSRQPPAVGHRQTGAPPHAVSVVGGAPASGFSSGGRVVAYWRGPAPGPDVRAVSSLRAYHFPAVEISSVAASFA